MVALCGTAQAMADKAIAARRKASCVSDKREPWKTLERDSTREIYEIC